MSVRVISLATSAHLRSRATLQLQSRQATASSLFARNNVQSSLTEGRSAAKAGALRRLGPILASGAAAAGIMSSAKDQYPTDALKQVVSVVNKQSVTSMKASTPWVWLHLGA
jgi:hypothetical protein